MHTVQILQSNKCCHFTLIQIGNVFQIKKTRNIGARTKVMGRKNFQESINYCFYKQKVTVYSLHNMYVDEFRGDPLFKTARKYINKEMVKFRGVSKNEMTLYLQIGHTETAVQIACDMCVTQHKGKTNVEKPTEFLCIKNKVSCA